MALSLVKCSKCQATVFPENLSAETFFPCPSCGSQLAVEIFPAILKTPVAVASELVLAPGESSCFYHPEKKAAIVCEGCGRFICTLCDLELNGRHICPVCLETGQKKTKFQDLENSRMLWGHVALASAVFPLVFIFTSIIGAPVALYLVLRYRKTPGSITGSSGAYFVAAAIIALLEIGAWGFVLIYYLTRR